MKYFISLMTYLFIITNSYSQAISGTILNKKTREPLAYVNIGIVGENIGTVTNSQGEFNINILPKYKNDTLRISTLGFKTQDFIVFDFKKVLQTRRAIQLEEDIQELDEVILSTKKLKEKVLGNRTTSKFFTARFASNTLGNELGIIIKVKKSPTQIKKFNVSIANNDYENLKFRLNFYSLKNGLPDKNILNKNIIVTSNIKSGILSIDLNDYDIVMTDDFLVSLEWIENLGEKDLSFSAGLFGSSLIVRKTSQGNWGKAKGISIGFNVLAKY